MSTSGEYRTAVHIMELVRLVERSPGQTRSVNWLAERLGVHRRTIRRWARGLEDVPGPDGGPLVQLRPGSPGREATVFMLRTRRETRRGDWSALALGLASTRYLAATGAQQLEELAESMMGRLGNHDAELRARLTHAFHYIPFGAKSYVAKPDEVDAVFSGVLYRWTLDFDYLLVKSGRTIRVRAEPWSLVIYKDALYMLGRRLNLEPVVMRTYAIDRMSAVEADRRARFEVPDDFEPDDYFGDLGLWKPDREREVLEVVFSAEEAPFVRERDWPGVVSRSALEDGSFKLVLDVLISPEVEKWLFSYGPEVEVLRPAWLRERMKLRTKALGRIYG